MATFHASDGAELGYDDVGPTGGMPLLLLHGWYGSRTLWEGVREALAGHYRTIAFDLRGFGESAGAPGPYTLDAFANDCSDLIAALDLDPLVAIGTGLGAAVALRFGIDRPDAVEGLVLVSPPPPSGLPLGPAARIALEATAGSLDLRYAWLAAQTHEAPLAMQRSALRAAAAVVGPQAATDSLVAWLDASFADDAETVSTPTLVVAGAEDALISPELARSRVAGVIPSSRAMTLANAASLVPIDAPRELAVTIVDFVDEL